MTTQPEPDGQHHQRDQGHEQQMSQLHGGLLLRANEQGASQFKQPVTAGQNVPPFQHPVTGEQSIPPLPHSVTEDQSTGSFLRPAAEKQGLAPFQSPDTDRQITPPLPRPETQKQIAPLVEYPGKKSVSGLKKSKPFVSVTLTIVLIALVVGFTQLSLLPKPNVHTVVTSAPRG